MPANSDNALKAPACQCPTRALRDVIYEMEIRVERDNYITDRETWRDEAKEKGRELDARRAEREIYDGAVSAAESYCGEIKQLLSDENKALRARVETLETALRDIRDIDTVQQGRTVPDLDLLYQAKGRADAALKEPTA